MLGVAAAQLFEATADMGTEAVVSILTALRTVSNRGLPAAAQLTGQPKCAVVTLHACYCVPLIRCRRLLLANCQAPRRPPPRLVSHPTRGRTPEPQGEVLSCW